MRSDSGNATVRTRPQNNRLFTLADSHFPVLELQNGQPVAHELICVRSVKIREKSPSSWSSLMSVADDDEKSKVIGMKVGNDLTTALKPILISLDIR